MESTKKEYQTPTVEIVLIASRDIITSSLEVPDEHNDGTPEDFGFDIWG